jgi:hypothetical protein
MGYSRVSDGRLRKGLERRFSLSRQRVLRLACNEVSRPVWLEAVADLNEAAVNLAVYLLATGEPGWVGPPLVTGANDNSAPSLVPHNILSPSG